MGQLSIRIKFNFANSIFSGSSTERGHVGIFGLGVLPERAVAACPEDAMFIEDPVWRVALILPGGSLTSMVEMC